jgi:general secretion pathway protein G
MFFDRQGRRRRTAGFSLVEVMIVLVIIGLLAGVVSINARSYIMKARQHTARQEIATIVKALNTYYATYGQYPTNEEGLGSLTKPTDKISEPLLDGDPVDPWGNPYQYSAPGSKGPFEVISYGADGKPGGEGAETDLSSDNLKG